MTWLLYIAAGIAGLLALGVLYQQLGVARDAKLFPPPGRMVDLGGRRLHVQVAGEGPFTVILESGVGASSPSWRLVLPEVAKFARVIAYDRAGLSWSDPCPQPITPEQVLSDLRSALAAVGAQPPYVFVGHSYGGLVGQIFAARYRCELAGMVLLDPPHPSEWHPQGLALKQAMLRRGATLSRRGAWCARLGINRFLLHLLTLGITRGPRAFVVAVSGRGVTVANRVVREIRKLPPDVYPILKAIWSQPKCFESMGAHLESLPALCAEAAKCSAPGALGDLPLVVLTAANPTPERLAHQDEVAALSTQGRHLIAARSGHWIQFDEPELVIEMIRSIIRPADEHRSTPQETETLRGASR